MEDGLCWFGGGGGGRLDGLSGILGEGCVLVMVRVGEGLEKGLWKNKGRQFKVCKGKGGGVGRARPVAKACEVGRVMD